MRNILPPCVGGLLAVLIAFCFLISAPRAGSGAEGNVEVDGTVADADGTPLANVQVLVRQGHRTIALRTDVRGRYNAQLRNKEPFEILYRHPGGGFASITSLSGAHKQHLNVVLYRNSQVGAMALEEIQAEVQAYERAAFLFGVADKAARRVLRENLFDSELPQRWATLQTRLGNLAGSDRATSSLQERFRSVRQDYTAALGDAGGTGKDRPTIKVGILHSLTGVVAIPESQLRDVELMAIEEINQAGGVLGRQVEAISEDPQSRFVDRFPEKARKLLLQDKVAAVFGCWTSVSRKFVLPVFEQNNGLLFYPAAYEGNECSQHVIYSGAVPNQQVLPAVDWLLQKGYRKFYLLGSDYVYPRTVNLIVRKYLKAKGLEAVAEKYTHLGNLEYANLVQDIKQAQPDVILSSIIGDSNVNFYNDLANQGITAGDLERPGQRRDQIPVLALLVGEDELRGLDPRKLKGHLAAGTYFQSLDNPVNKAFVRRFRDRFGKHLVTHDAVAAAYAQVYLWKLAVEKARSTDVDAVRKALRSGLEFDAPEGKIKVDPRTQHVYKTFRLGRIREDKQFDILHESRTAIEPEPYPQIAFPGWHCDWTRGGLIRGRP